MKNNNKNISFFLKPFKSPIGYTPIRLKTVFMGGCLYDK